MGGGAVATEVLILQISNSSVVLLFERICVRERKHLLSYELFCWSTVVVYRYMYIC